MAIKSFITFGPGVFLSVASGVNFINNLMGLLASSPSLLLAEFPWNGETIDLVPIHMSLQEVAVCAGNKVLMEVDNNCVLITDYPQGILGQ